MASSTDFPAHGKIIRVEDGAVIFAPSNTTYELKLLTAHPYEGPMNTPVEAYIHVVARKMWTVPSGGNFITPIHGPSRIIQGRIKYLDQRTMVVQAGAPFVVELPLADNAWDLNSGPVAVGALVNCTILPGAMLEVATASVTGK